VVENSPQVQTDNKDTGKSRDIAAAKTNSGKPVETTGLKSAPAASPSMRFKASLNNHQNKGDAAVIKELWLVWRYNDFPL